MCVLYCMGKSIPLLYVWILRVVVYEGNGANLFCRNLILDFSLFL